MDRGRNWRNLLVPGVFLIVGLVLGSAAHAQSPKTTIVLLYEQLDASLIESTETPAFDRMRKEGAWTHEVAPVFPNTTVSNAFTVSTGCWPQNHGIVLDRFRDPERGDYDRSLNADWTTGCTPLNEVLNRKRAMVGALGWAGRFRDKASLASMVSQERTPDDFKGDDARMISVGHFVKMPITSRPRIVLAYLEGAKGAKTEAERRAALQAADATVGKLIEDVEALPDSKMLAIVVASARGVQPSELPEAVSAAIGSTGKLYASEGTGFVYLDGADAAAVSEKLAAIEGVSVATRDQQPENWKLGSGPRVGDLIVSRTSEEPGLFYAWGRGVGAGRKLPAMSAADINPTVLRGLMRITDDYSVDGKIIGELLKRPLAAQAKP